MARTSHVRAGGLVTRYLEAGPSDGEAETLVLLHDGAFGSDAVSCWSPVIERLAERYRVLAPDLLGHGGTAKVAFFDADPLSQRVNHVRDFCAALCVAEAAFVGSSFGGGMILRAAAAGSLPMSRGVSICGPGGILMVGEQFAQLQNYEPTLEWAQKVSNLMVVDPPPEMALDRLERSKTPGHYESLAAARLRSPARDGDGPDWRPAYREALGRAQTPVLLVAGSADALLEPDWEQTLAELMPGGRAVEFAGMRHQPHLQDPDAVCEALVAFLDDTRA
ncbi:MAG TPA: alpha/beta hydrolase [Conexibacter sp.]|jgi:pimeloyl-ACP methyl ester carboxylesterase